MQKLSMMAAAAAAADGGGSGYDMFKWNLFLLHNNVEHSNYKLSIKNKKTFISSLPSLLECYAHDDGF